jgi:hypothetical protein
MEMAHDFLQWRTLIVAVLHLAVPCNSTAYFTVYIFWRFHGGCQPCQYGKSFNVVETETRLVFARVLPYTQLLQIDVMKHCRVCLTLNVGEASSTSQHVDVRKLQSNRCVPVALTMLCPCYKSFSSFISLEAGIARLYIAGLRAG